MPQCSLPLVESFTCRNEEKEPEVNYNDMLAIERDNSIVIFDEQGRPLTEPVTRSMRKTGNNKDLLDYGTCIALCLNGTEPPFLLVTLFSPLIVMCSISKCGAVCMQ